MAKIPLLLTGWSYDEATNRVVVSFQEAPDSADPNPAAYEAARTFDIEFAPQALRATPVPRRPRP